MEPKEVQKLRGAVMEGLQDGRRMETLKSALRDSGYSEYDIESITSDIDQSKIKRKPPKKKNFDYVAAGIIIIVIIAGSYFLFAQPSESPTGEVITGDGNGNGPNQNDTRIKICYASNETIKQVMIEAGAQCDRWYIIMPSP